MNQIEEGLKPELDFAKLARSAGSQSVIPVVVQDAESREVLILAFVNEAALARTFETRIVTFWSTTRNELWIKGETSGNRLHLVEARVNCEQNSLLFLVRVEGSGACHTRKSDGKYRASCFYRTYDGTTLAHRPGTN
ncbi:MAG: phosphoribosyl-AMP cyclohydrolase [Leptospirales bacterium]|nr:phosphoribosyl-AMP cyclohydrolase [Leptospirales bacterium]